MVVQVGNETPPPPVEERCDGLGEKPIIIPPGCVYVREGPQFFYPYGYALYLNGPDLDRPLSIYRGNHSDVTPQFTVQPIPNWKGDLITAAFANGQAADCMATTQASCIDIQWPGERVWHGWEKKDPELVRDGPRHWMGSLVYGSADASGLLYRRNRYYDPVAGQFTQEDPIGLAGGINLYGYANGDPVNFGDPFGLMACPDEEKDENGECPAEEGKEEPANDEMVVFVSFGGSLMPGGGLGGGSGVSYVRGQGLPGGLGIYTSGTVAGGVDVGPNIEIGSGSRRAVFGAGFKTCGGVAWFAVCNTDTRAGSVRSLQVGPRQPIIATAGVTEASGGQTLLETFMEFNRTMRAFLYARAGAPVR